MKRVLLHVLVLLSGAWNSRGQTSSNIRNILVVRQHDQLGDMLCAVPLLRCLKQSFPDATLTLVASRVNHDIMQHHPYVDKLLLYDKKAFRTSPAAAWSFLKNVRAIRSDVSIVPATVSVSVTSDLISALSRAPMRIGAMSLNGRDNPSSGCHTQTVALDWRATPHAHQTARNIRILDPLGLKCSDSSHLVGLSEVERMDAERVLRPFRTAKSCLIGFHPGAGKPENRWPADRFAAVINRLCNEQNAAAVMTIGPMDTTVRNVIMPLINSPVKIIEGASIRTIAATIDAVDLFLTNDTGIMHVAGGTQTPTLALFGPTDPQQWAPLGAGMKIIHSPTGGMDGIGTDQVYDMLMSMLPLLRHSGG